MAGPKAKASYVSWTPDEEQQLAVRMVDLQASDPDASMGWMLMAAQDVLPVTRRRPYATWYKVSDVHGRGPQEGAGQGSGGTGCQTGAAG
jgi:hypothetical protein